MKNTIIKIGLISIIICLSLILIAANGCPWNQNTDEATIAGSSFPIASAVSALSATAISSTQINLSWQNNSNNALGFKVERKTGASGIYTEIATVSSISTTYSDTGLTSSTTYYYRVRAYNTNGYSMYSNEVNATTQLSPEMIGSAMDIAMDDNFLYILGGSWETGGGEQWRIEKRNKTTLELTQTFGLNGVVISNPTINENTGGYDYPIAIKIDDSYLYIIGYDESLGHAQWRIEKRDKTTGMLVTAFGSNGIVLNNPSSPRDDIPNNISVDSNYLYLIGYSQFRNVIIGDTYWEWRIEKRDKTTGALVNSFGSNGVITSTPTSNAANPSSIIVNNDYIYIAGNNQSQWQIEKRDKITGTLVTSFGITGVVFSSNIYIDNGNSMVDDTNYIYIAGNYLSQWGIEKRDKITGTLVNSFGITGAVFSNTGGLLESIAMDNNYLYIVGSDMSPGNAQWRIEKRYNITGTLVTEFGNNGVVLNNPSNSGGWDDEPFAVAVDDNYIYIVGKDSTVGQAQWRIEKRSKITGAQ